MNSNKLVKNPKKKQKAKKITKKCLPKQVDNLPSASNLPFTEYVVGDAGLLRESLAEVNRRLVLVCPPTCMPDRKTAKRTLKRAIEWSEHSWVFDIISLYSVDIDTMLQNGHDEKDSAVSDNCLDDLAHCEGLIILTDPEDTILKSKHVEFAMSNSMPIFDVSSNPVKAWNYETNQFEFFCVESVKFPAMKWLLDCYYELVVVPNKPQIDQSLPQVLNN